MDRPKPPQQRFPWGWGVVALACVGQCWLPFWFAISQRVLQFEHPRLNWTLHWFGAHSVAIALTALWLAERRRVDELPWLLALLGVPAALIMWIGAWIVADI